MFTSKATKQAQLAARIAARKKARTLESAYNARQALERDSFGLLTVKVA